MKNATASESNTPAAKFERRKAMIVRAAVKVINQKGVRGMTFAEIAASLKLVPTAMNYYFKRKEDLAAACMLQAIAYYNALLDRSDRQPTPELGLRCFLQDFADHLAAADLGKVDAVVNFNDVRAIGDAVVDAAYTNMFRRLRRSFSSVPLNEPTRPGQNARTHLLISQVLWAELWLRQYEPVDYARMAQRLFDVLVHGLARPGQSWAPIDVAAPAANGEVSETSGVSREAFLQAATAEINEHGYLGASVSRISARLNVTKGTFYYYNQAKDDLVQQCFDRTFEKMRTSLSASEAATTSGFDTLASLAGSMTRRDVSGEAPLLRTTAISAVPEELQPTLFHRFAQLSARLASVVSDGIADGSIRPVDANVAAQAIICLINASAELRHWAPGLDADLAIEAYARPLFMGLFRPDERAPASEAKVAAKAATGRRTRRPAQRTS
ncbi:MAG TPA: TetR/AcrR family transcriptional regulator [Povalibacter sp.]|uniref:TetR/AcrR family transcriptional regulator n=1 Tax=Povalibacter sp. TaxID=1962978 RepID=UPI002CA1BB1B|nr:TetR/AcrR family transcriptional regulator [Povalibacter sp.]HMN46438.1 TetR/AcrR family transcriptional regulator [Povalibacter sp.]